MKTLGDKNRPGSLSSDDNWIRDLTLLVAVSVPFLFWGIGSVSFLDPDEGMYGDIARGMAIGGDWIRPHFNALPYLEKPPLYFWLGGLTMKLFGPSEWAIRLWSALPALGSVLLAWQLGRLIYGPKAGLIAGLALATNVGFVLYVRKVSTDFLLVFSLTLAMYGFVRHCLSMASEQWATKNGSPAIKDRGGWARTISYFRWIAEPSLLFWLGMALGVLSKGLIGMVFPLMIVGIFLLVANGKWQIANGGGRGLFTIHHSLFTRYYSLFVNRAGLLLFGILVLPWHIVVAWRDPDLFWFYMVDNQILRFLNLRAFIEDDVAISSLGFLAVTFIWFFPWGVFLAARPPKVYSNGNPLGWVMVIWALLIIGFFTLSRSRLEYYALPAFPALAVLVGGAWGSGRDIGRWLVIGWVGCIVVGFLAIWVGTGLTRDQAAAGLAEMNVYYRILRDQGLPFPFSSARPFSLLLQVLGAGLVVGWSLSMFLWLRRGRRAAFGVLLCLAGVIAGLIFSLLRVVEPHHSAKEVSMAITSEANHGDLVVHEGSLEYSGSLPFYTGRRIVVLNGKRGDLDFSSRLPEARGWFLGTQDLADIWAGSERVFLVTQKPMEKSALSSIPASNIHQIGQYGSRSLYSNQPAERKTIANRTLKIG